MYKKINFKVPKNSQNTGFITLEVIISIIIALAFVAVSLQTLVYAKYMQVAASEKKRADELIQEDIEQLNSIANGNILDSRLASILTDNNTNICSATNYNSGYAQGLWYAFTNQDYNGDSIYSSPIIDWIDRDEDGEVDIGEFDIDIDPMNDGNTINTNPNYEANPTKRLLSKVNADGSITSEGTTLTLNRTHISNNSGSSDPPHKTIKIYYRVTNSNNELVADRYVEVIPDVALECP